MKTKKLTDEQKAKFAPMLHATWSAIAPDCESMLSRRGRVGEIIEVTCDANRPEQFGGMSHKEYEELMLAFNHPDTKKWLRKVLNY